jgi:hypothetical protein
MPPTASRHRQGLAFFVRRAAASWQLHIYVLALQKNRRLGGEPMIVFDSVTESVRKDFSFRTHCRCRSSGLHFDQ